MELNDLKGKDGLLEFSENIPKDKKKILWHCRIEFDYAERDKNLFKLKDERFLQSIGKDFVDFYLVVNGTIKNAVKIIRHKYIKKLTGIKKIYLSLY